ncbi:hypothetical protein BGX26_005588 [Mortierella sp. AD094]|nr:hypothetical protein BGX26_005588 [Mortierella sp. AD094]
MNSFTAPMQVFEFQADSSVSLVSTAAINRKSCDHCFLNRKTCDKVRQAADSGEKCKRCAKDNRPCTFTPTVHLYHIADCVGRHQCRAKVIQAMGGVKKEVQFKTIEIPIVCDMDNDIDRTLFEYIQKNPNLLVYNNRIKSFLAQDMLGISPDQDPASSISNSYGQSASNYSYPQIPSPSGNARGSFSSDQSLYGSNNNPLTSPIQGPMKPYVQHNRPHPYANAIHQRNNSEDRSQQLPIRPSLSPRAHPAQNHVARHGSTNSEVFAGLTNAGISGSQVSPSASPISLSPLDSAAALSFDQRRPSGGFVADMTASVNPYGGAYQQVQPFQQQQQQHHPYAARSPYPQPQFFQPQPQFSQQQYVNNNSYRTPSPFSASPVAPSPIQQYNSQPPSPLELSLSVGTNLGTLSNNSHQNLTSLFDNTLTMGNQSQSSQALHRRQPSLSSLSASDSASPAMSNNNQGDIPTSGSSAPMVITTLNEEGHEVGFYYAVPAVSLNPGASDADLFQDFTVMEDTLGENFVWVENLFDENATGVVAGDASGSNLSSSSAIPIPGGGVPNMTGTNTESMMMEGLLAQQRQQQQHDEWSSQYTPQDSYGNHGLQG